MIGVEIADCNRPRSVARWIVDVVAKVSAAIVEEHGDRIYARGCGHHVPLAVALRSASARDALSVPAVA